MPVNVIFFCIVNVIVGDVSCSCCNAQCLYFLSCIWKIKNTNSQKKTIMIDERVYGWTFLSQCGVGGHVLNCHMIN